MLSAHSVIALESTVSKRKHFEPVYSFCDLFSYIKYFNQYFQLQATPLNWCKLFQISWGDGGSSPAPTCEPALEGGTGYRLHVLWCWENSE